ncbi:hypothetical protein EYF80_028149 [Liparis tanakae]|uniref:Uncharacterized protein n=1 Tax=Liparis tanakae TaxID=230148 RepID=A0A4Z2H9U4_9TELE|nr:hypothetical protein EYF80_028149 [Liparis tanakae]
MALPACERTADRTADRCRLPAARLGSRKRAVQPRHVILSLVETMLELLAPLRLSGLSRKMRSESDSDPSYSDSSNSCDSPDSDGPHADRRSGPDNSAGGRN